MYRSSIHLRSVILQIASLFFFFLAGSSPSSAISDPCHAALPLQLDQAMPGYVSVAEPARFTFTVEVPSFLLVEAHGTGMTPAPDVRFLDAACRARSSNLDLPAIRGRHVHRLAPGTYFVEVVAHGLGGGPFRLDAWLALDHNEIDPPPPPADEPDEWIETRTPISTFDNDGPGDPPPPPADEPDEWIEARTPISTFDNDGPGDPPPPPADEPDEWIEARIAALEQPTWLTMAGRGAAELVTTAFGSKLVVHDWCPWTRRPGLLSTYTCAQPLVIGDSGPVRLRLPYAEASQLFAVELPRDGELALERFGAAAVVRDRGGRLLHDLGPGDSVRLAAGHYYVRLAADGASPAEAVELYFDLD